MASDVFEAVYIPAQNEPHTTTTICLNDALEDYIQREFPELSEQTASSYLVPAAFQSQANENLSAIPSSLISKEDHLRSQGDAAEEVVFNSLKYMKIPGVVFHGRPYINESKNSRTFKEHDFVILTAEKRICLIEVKCCADSSDPLVKVLSNGKSIKDNRRSGLHQLDAHTSVLHDKFGVHSSVVGQILAWPFLTGHDPQGRERFTQDVCSGKKHFFKDVCRDIDKFSAVLSDYLNQLPVLEGEIWNLVLRWFTLLGCSAVIDTLTGTMDSQLILLSQEQLAAVYSQPNNTDGPVVIYGPPGSGKTVLILIIIKKLWKDNKIGPGNKCLLLTGRYGSGLKHFARKCLEKHGIEHVIIKSLPASHEVFQSWCDKETEKFTHVFVDGIEDLGWYGNIQKNMNFLRLTWKSSEQGYFWCTMDGSQLLYNLAIPGGPNAISQVTPQISLSKTFRSTGNIFTFTKSCIPVCNDITEDSHVIGAVNDKITCHLPMQKLSLAHKISGPPVYFVNSENFVSREEAVCLLIIDLCGRKGIKPNDLVLMTSASILQGRLNITAINQGFEKFFSSKGFIPKGIVGVQRFLDSQQEERFCVSSASGYKGLEAKVVIAVPLLFNNSSQEMIQRMMYSMSSRCLCLLVIVWNQTESVGVMDAEQLSQYAITSSESQLKQFFKDVDQHNKAEIEKLRKEEERLKTFETYPLDANVKPTDLAKNGFIYRDGNTSDSVMCVFCGGVLYDWEPNDVPSKEHEKFYSNCPFVKGENVNNVPIL